MKIFNKISIVILTLMLIISKNIVYASMADYTDEQADQNLIQERQEWEKEQQERINKSSNNYLKSLSVKDYKITPDFDKQTINYEVTKEISKSYIEIEAETDDENASVSGAGKISLNAGENNIQINVTAQNGTTRTYYIKATCKAKDAPAENTETEDVVTNLEINNEETQQQVQETEKDYKKIAIIAIPVALILIAIALIIKKKSKQKGKH